MFKLGVIQSEYANLYSVENALKYLGEEAIVRVSHSEQLEGLDAVILPGVGSFAQVQGDLQEKGLFDGLKDFLKTNKPFLGICVGMQMLFERGLEGGLVTEGLGFFAGSVNPIPHDKVARLPHIGWNGIQFVPEQPLFAGFESGEQMYFVHSYHCEAVDSCCELARTELRLGYSVLSAVKRGAVYGVQFHPERSGPCGLKVLENFLDLARLA